MSKARSAIRTNTGCIVARVLKALFLNQPHATRYVMVPILMAAAIACGTAATPGATFAPAQTLTPTAVVTSTPAPPVTNIPTPTVAPNPTNPSDIVASLRDVQRATIQIQAEGSFVDQELGQQLNRRGRGSGLIIEQAGIAVTNNHVVTGAAILQVWIGGESNPRNARILGASECSDLAVIDIEGDGYPVFEWFDGHPIVRQGLAAVLAQEEDLVVVSQAENGLEAVAQAGDLHPDIILMDLQMPEMDGVEAIKKIKGEAPDIGIIILTTYDTDDYIFRGIEAGARGYLLKDSPPSEVLNAIRAVHKGESLIQPKVASRLLDRFSQISRTPVSSEVISPRETEILQLMATGAGNRAIATQLIIGESTVKTHVIHIFNKLGVKARTEAVAEATRRGIIQL